jgi:pimeloyl-ACP methyl ester carboxylesterase
LGHSFGGVLSSLILARQPALFQRAVLLDPVLFTPNMLRLKQVLGALGLYDRLNDKAKRARARRNHWADADEARNRLRGRGIFKNWDEAALTAYVDNAMKPHPEGGLQLKCHPEREAEVFSTAPQGLWRALRQVRTPATLIYGQDSYPFVLDSARRLPRLNPQVQARAVEGGHCFMQERPQATARLVQDYLLGN